SGIRMPPDRRNFVPAKNSLGVYRLCHAFAAICVRILLCEQRCFWHAGSDFADLAGFKGTGKRISHSFLHRDRSRDCPMSSFLLQHLWDDPRILCVLLRAGSWRREGEKGTKTDKM